MRSEFEPPTKILVNSFYSVPRSVHRIDLDRKFSVPRRDGDMVPGVQRGWTWENWINNRRTSRVTWYSERDVDRPDQTVIGAGGIGT